MGRKERIEYLVRIVLKIYREDDGCIGQMSKAAVDQRFILRKIIRRKFSLNQGPRRILGLTVSLEAVQDSEIACPLPVVGD